MRVLKQAVGSRRGLGARLTAAVATACAVGVAVAPPAAATTQAYSWGANTNGELGNGSTKASNVPGVLPLAKVKAVAAGDNFSVFLMSNGTVMTAGRGFNGQLGNGKAESTDTPVHVSGLTGVKAVAAGAYSAMALKTDGTVWSWGSYEYGQVGNGKVENTYTPVEILTGVKAIASEGAHDLALLANGSVVAWGRNGNGELGQGTTEPNFIPAPVAVPGLTGVKAIATGQYHSLAVVGGGAVDAWGDNESGQVGDGKSGEVAITSPARIPGLKGVKSVSAGSYFSLALLSNGTAEAWGSNGEGDLGVGSELANLPTPTPVAGLTEAKLLVAHGSWAAALRSNGGVEDWGANFGGELGRGPGEGSNHPVTVSGLSGVTSLAAGFGFGLATAP